LWISAWTWKESRIQFSYIVICNLPVKVLRMTNTRIFFRLKAYFTASWRRE
jgi:hypothetical protein